METPVRQTLGDEARAVAWWVLVGAAAGAIAGFLVGGVGGRLAMLVLRLTSPDTVVGLTSDDGFEIGILSADTFRLLLGMAAAGAVNGVAYAALRGVIPRRVRLPLWSLLTAVLVGSAVVHSDGVDFTLIEPAALAITLFVLLPGAAAALVVVLVERWIGLEPVEHRRLVATLACAALLGTLALLVAAVVGLVSLLVRRVSGLAALLRAVARVAVPVVLVVLVVLGCADLVRDVSAIL